MVKEHKPHKAVSSGANLDQIKSNYHLIPDLPDDIIQAKKPKIWRTILPRRRQIAWKIPSFFLGIVFAAFGYDLVQPILRGNPKKGIEETTITLQLMRDNIIKAFSPAYAAKLNAMQQAALHTWIEKSQSATTELLQSLPAAEYPMFDKVDKNNAKTALIKTLLVLGHNTPKDIERYAQSYFDMKIKYSGQQELTDMWHQVKRQNNNPFAAMATLITIAKSPHDALITEVTRNIFQELNSIAYETFAHAGLYNYTPDIKKQSDAIANRQASLPLGQANQPLKLSEGSVLVAQSNTNQ